MSNLPVEPEFEQAYKGEHQSSQLDVIVCD